jgi:hypothetical protein
MDVIFPLMVLFVPTTDREFPPLGVKFPRNLSTFPFDRILIPLTVPLSANGCDSTRSRQRFPLKVVIIDDCHFTRWDGPVTNRESSGVGKDQDSSLSCSSIPTTSVFDMSPLAAANRASLSG